MLFSACNKEEKKTSSKKENTVNVEATQIIPQESKQETDGSEEQKNPYKDVREMMLEAGFTEIQYQAYSLHASYIEPETYISFHKTFEDAETLINRYRYGGFIDYYTFETYYDLITTLRTTGEKSVTPRCALNDRLFFAERNISTYNKVEESIAILSVEGEIVLEWDPQWTGLDQCGDYFFLETYADGTYVCYVVNKEGRIITNLAYNTGKYDIGEGYVFLCGGRGKIMSPQGEVVELREEAVRWNPSTGMLEKGQELGKISEGLFYGFSERPYVNVARYYSTTGETVIELSSHKINFKVTKLYDFSNGQAKIEFTGADNKYYYGFIDKTGAFIGEPIEMTESSEDVPTMIPSKGGAL